MVRREELESSTAAEDDVAGEADSGAELLVGEILGKSTLDEELMAR